jgi:hypothetical protein
MRLCLQAIEELCYIMDDVNGALNTFLAWIHDRCQLNTSLPAGYKSVTLHCESQIEAWKRQVTYGNELPVRIATYVNANPDVQSSIDEVQAGFENKIH